MCGNRSWLGMGLSVLMAVAGCAGTEPAPAEHRPAIQAPVHQAPTREETAARVEQDLRAAREQILARADSVRSGLVGVRGLSRQETADLRRDVNAAQIAVARSMGVRAQSEAEIQRLVRQGRLVTLEDSTQYWVLRKLEHSVPYVTPDTRAMLEEIGRRFHARLDSLELPRYRMQITSVMRTPQTQARLRRSNSNASRGVSAHEFGTTLDVAHARFAAPEQGGLTVEIPSDPSMTAPMQYVEGLVLEETARKHASALQAELGRVLREMRAERKVRVMMERRQAVYHMTVARRFPARTVSG